MLQSSGGIAAVLLSTAFFIVHRSSFIVPALPVDRRRAIVHR
jgi:hypothetical protein